jgi:hypothetical protein
MGDLPATFDCQYHDHGWLLRMASHSPLQLKVAQGCSTTLEPSYFLYPLEMKDCNGKSLINGAFEQEHHL